MSADPGGEREPFASLFAVAGYGRPLAAELPEVAELLGRPLVEVKRAAHGRWPPERHRPDDTTTPGG